MGVQINPNVVTTGVVVNAKQGEIRLDSPMEDGSERFRSASVNRYPDGTRLELTFRIGSKSQRQLVKATEIKATDRFRVALIDVAEGVNLNEFTTWLNTFLGLNDADSNSLADEINAYATPGSGKIAAPTVAVGLSYDDGRNLAVELTENAGGNATFEIIKHTKDDMPETVHGFNPDVVNQLEWVNGHWIQPSLRPLFLAGANAMSDGEVINFALSGPSGYGKTSAYEAFAAWLNFDIMRVNCPTVLDNEAWFGYHEARGGDTVFIPTDFTKAVRRGRTIIIMDEINRVEPWLHNSLFPLLDHARATIVHGEEIVCGPSLIFGMTANVGPQYAGTFTFDWAFLNRVDFTDEMIAPPRDVEEKILQFRYPSVQITDIRRIVGVMDELRRVVAKDQLQLDVSTRTALKLTRGLKLGLTPRQAAQYTIVNVTQAVDRKPIVDVINSRLGME